MPGNLTSVANVIYLVRDLNNVYFRLVLEISVAYLVLLILTGNIWFCCKKYLGDLKKLASVSSLLLLWWDFLTKLPVQCTVFEEIEAWKSNSTDDQWWFTYPCSELHEHNWAFAAGMQMSQFRFALLSRTSCLNFYDWKILLCLRFIQL